MHTLITVGLFSPLIGFLILVATSKFIKRKWAGLVGCVSIFISLLCFTTLLFEYNPSPIQVKLYNWISVSNIHADFSLHLDSLSLLMTLIITGVGFLIHVYSIGYMDHDRDYARFFACMNFFVFAMLLLVLASNLLLLFVGWEGVGLASYLLIGFWYERPKAASAATKAFVINRIGDLGFLLGLLLTFFLFGTTDILELTRQAEARFDIGSPTITILSLLLFIGAVGKSAQLPLHTWLPDAMEGPTPVSALIHAATMVTAGVYLVVRLHDLFSISPFLLHFIAYVGIATSLFAAICAMGQKDLKRVLAYSTVSQLGLMFLAAGIGAFYAAMFHLTTHAFVKALLFLSAGNVVHMLHGTTEIEKMGGLHKIFNKTNALFLIGVLSMSGIPPLAAFFSKDLILEQEYLAGFKTLFVLALIVSLLTAFYLTRAYFLTFRGPSHLDDHHKHMAKEAPIVMIWPVSVLAFLSVFGGLLGFAFGRTALLESFLAKSDVMLAIPDEGPFTIHTEMILAISAAIIGVFAAAFLYTRYANQLKRPLKFLIRAFYVDEIYWILFVVPFRGIANLLSHYIEPKIFDKSIMVSATATESIAGQLQRMQSGQIRSYIAWMTIGVVSLVLYLVL